MRKHVFSKPESEDGTVRAGVSSWEHGGSGWHVGWAWPGGTAKRERFCPEVEPRVRGKAAAPACRGHDTQRPSGSWLSRATNLSPKCCPLAHRTSDVEKENIVWQAILENFSTSALDHADYLIWLEVNQPEGLARRLCSWEEIFQGDCKTDGAFRNLLKKVCAPFCSPFLPPVLLTDAELTEVFPQSYHYLLRFWSVHC